MSGHAHASGFRGLGRTEVAPPDELEPIDAHLARITARLAPSTPVERDLDDALGLALAEDVTSAVDLPPFDSSAMDGYALRAADASDTREGSPARLRVAGEVPAGATEVPAVPHRAALRIMTGAPLPPDADTVVPVELTREADRTVEIFRRPEAGDNIRPAGEAVRRGRRVLDAGELLRPPAIALLAAVGRSVVRCYPPPRVAVLSTGDEIVPVGEEPGPGRILDANGPLLTNLVRRAGAQAAHRGVVPDDPAALRAALSAAVADADLVLTSGGASAGTHDHVRDVLRELGEVRFTKLAMKPGMPQLAGRIGGVPVVGLPGNPVSVFVSFEVLVLPALRILQGRRDRSRPTVQARLGTDVRTPAHKRTFLRVRLEEAAGGGLVATPAGHQGSHVLTSAVEADGLAEIPEERTALAAGEEVRVRLLVEP